jgi:type VI secretion system protein ImpH
MSTQIPENVKGYDFFKLMQILEKSEQQGQWADTQFFLDQKLRMKPENKISFPGSDVASLKMLDNGKWEMVLNFMGLYGVSSPLPSYFYEPITIKKENFESLRIFLDLFNNRIYGLFYQSWKKYRHLVCFEKDALDSYTKRLYTLVGKEWGLNRKMTRAEVAFELKLIPYSKLLSTRGRSAANLKKVIQGVFDFPAVRIEQFVPKRVNNPSPSKLGQCQLGLNSLLGHTLNDAWNNVKIVLYDLNFTEWKELLIPSGELPLAKQVQAVIEQFFNSPMSYTVEARFIPPDKKHRSMLGQTQLGWHSWLGKPQDDVVVELFSSTE